MAQFVRAGLRHNRWVETAERSPADYPADVITDLRTQGNALSVFEVTATISAERIAIAVAAGKQEPQETGYSVFDSATTVKLGIKPTKARGNTIDADVNSCHYNLAVGTVSKLVDLAEVLATGGLVPILRKKVEELLKDGLTNHQLDGSRMNPGLRNKLQNVSASTGTSLQ